HVPRPGELAALQRRDLSPADPRARARRAAREDGRPRRREIPGSLAFSETRMRLLDTYHRLVKRRIEWSGGHSTVREASGRRLHVYEIGACGSGPVVVLLRGVGGTANTWVPVLSALRPAFRKLWVPDLPGHGFSPLAPGEQPLDVQGHYEVFASFCADV